MAERITKVDADRSVAALARALSLKFEPSYLKMADINKMCYRRGGSPSGEPGEYHATIIDPRTDEPYKNEPGAITLCHGGYNSLKYRIEQYRIGSTYSAGRYTVTVGTSPICGNTYYSPAEISAQITVMIGLLDLVTVIPKPVEDEYRTKLDRAYILAAASVPSITADRFCDALAAVLTANNDNRQQSAAWLARVALLTDKNEQEIGRLGYTKPANADRAIAAVLDLNTGLRLGGEVVRANVKLVEHAAAVAAALLAEVDTAEEGTRNGQLRSFAVAVSQVCGAATSPGIVLPGAIRTVIFDALINWATDLATKFTVPAAEIATVGSGS